MLIVIVILEVGIGGTNDGRYYASNSMFIQATNLMIFNTGGISSGNIPRMILNSSGNLGIGTNVIHAPIQLQTQVLSKQIVLYEEASNNYNFVAFGNGGGLLLQINDNVNDAFIFNVANNSSLATDNTELMRIKGIGNVGIGTNNPNCKLSDARHRARRRVAKGLERGRAGLLRGATYTGPDSEARAGEAGAGICPLDRQGQIGRAHV